MGGGDLRTTAHETLCTPAGVPDSALRRLERATVWQVRAGSGTPPGVLGHPTRSSGGRSPLRPERPPATLCQPSRVGFSVRLRSSGSGWRASLRALISGAGPVSLGSCGRPPCPASIHHSTFLLLPSPLTPSPALPFFIILHSSFFLPPSRPPLPCFPSSFCILPFAFSYRGLKARKNCSPFVGPPASMKRNELVRSKLVSGIQFELFTRLVVVWMT